MEILQVRLKQNDKYKSTLCTYAFKLVLFNFIYEDILVSNSIGTCLHTFINTNLVP